MFILLFLLKLKGTLIHMILLHPVLISVWNKVKAHKSRFMKKSFILNIILNIFQNRGSGLNLFANGWRIGCYCP